MRAFTHKESGYTLLEILVAMLIIAILVMVASFALIWYQDKAEDSRAKSHLLTVNAAALSSYERGQDFGSSQDMAELLEDKVPEFSYRTQSDGDINSTLSPDANKVWVETDAPDGVMLCLQSKTGKTYCMRTDTSAIRVECEAAGCPDSKGNDRVTNNREYAYAREIRADSKQSPSASRDLIATGTIQESNLGWDNKDKAKLAESIAPTVRLTCNLIAGQDPACPNSETPEDAAYFEWTVTDEVAAPTSVECFLDGSTTNTACDLTGLVEVSDTAPTEICSGTLDDGSSNSTARPDRQNMGCVFFGRTGGVRSADLSVGQHEFRVVAKNSSGESETSFSWLVNPDLPRVQIISNNPTVFDVTTDPAGIRETKQRTIQLAWDAEQLPGSDVGNLEEAYCLVQLSQPDGSYVTVFDDVCPHPNKLTARHWQGTIDMPSELRVPYNSVPLIYNNALPHKLTVTATNEAGASNTDRFDWKIVDHEKPEEPTIAAGDNNVCFAPNPYWSVNGTRSLSQTGGVITSSFMATANGNDVASGIYGVDWPNMDSAWIGSGGILLAPATAETRNPPQGPSFSYLPFNGREYQSISPYYILDGQPAPTFSGPGNMYTFGTFPDGIGNGITTFPIVIRNGAAPDYPGVSIDLTMQRDDTAPNTPSFVGGSSTEAWTNIAGPFTYNLSAMSDPAGAGCALARQHEYRTQRNDGGWSGPIVISGNSFSVNPIEGQHEIQIRTVDAAGNASPWSASRYLRIDRTAPNAPSAARSGTISGVEGWTNQNQTLSANANGDSGANSPSPYYSGVSQIVCAVSTGTCGITSGANSISFVTGAEGERTYTFNVQDVAGNWSGSGSASVRIDKTDPIASAVTVNNETCADEGSNGYKGAVPDSRGDWYAPGCKIAHHAHDSASQTINATGSDALSGMYQRNFNICRVDSVNAAANESGANNRWTCTGANVLSSGWTGATSDSNFCNSHCNNVNYAYYVDYRDKAFNVRNGSATNVDKFASSGQTGSGVAGSSACTNGTISCSVYAGGQPGGWPDGYGRPIASGGTADFTTGTAPNVVQHNGTVDWPGAGTVSAANAFANHGAWSARLSFDNYFEVAIMQNQAVAIPANATRTCTATFNIMQDPGASGFYGSYYIGMYTTAGNMFRVNFNGGNDPNDSEVSINGRPIIEPYWQRVQISPTFTAPASGTTVLFFVQRQINTATNSDGSLPAVAGNRTVLIDDLQVTCY